LQLGLLPEPATLAGRLKLPPSAWTRHRVEPLRQTNPRAGLGKGEEQGRRAGRSHHFPAPPRPICSSERDFRGSKELQGWSRCQEYRLGGLQQKPVLGPELKLSQTRPYLFSGRQAKRQEEI